MMRIFRLINSSNMATDLKESITQLKNGHQVQDYYELKHNAFDPIPGKPFAYWVSDDVRNLYKKFPQLEGNKRTAKQGLATADDYRFVRLWWEPKENLHDEKSYKWFPFAKGGKFSPYYIDIYLCVNWENDGHEIRNFKNLKTGKVRSRPQNTDFYFKEGLTWGDRTSSMLSVKPWPSGGVFSIKGSAGFFPDEDIYFVMGLMNSKAFNVFLEMMVNAGSKASRSYQVGIIGLVPYPEKVSNDIKKTISDKSKSSWENKRLVDTINETSHAFILPISLNKKVTLNDIGKELIELQKRIEDLIFELYEFPIGDKQQAENHFKLEINDYVSKKTKEPDFGLNTLLSWSVGVTFGRFDWKIATGDREYPNTPDPFDPVPEKSPGMLPDEHKPFHIHKGILVDDPSHEQDLTRLITAVLDEINFNVQIDLRKWLQKEFFNIHLQMYSKSRRKAPIYWPLTSPSENYTLWIYYPQLNDQTLYTVVNDFLEPKLKLIQEDLYHLKNKGEDRTRSEEVELEELLDFEKELIEFRNKLMAIAPDYKPNHDDGVEISAAPLWSLFSDRSWQRNLKKVWNQLEDGEYDWSYLAMNYWPERVVKACQKDRSFAIAHDLEEKLWEEVEVEKKGRGGKIKNVIEWRPKDLTETELNTIIESVKN